MGALGVDRVTLAKVLNHKSADNIVTAIYDRYERQPEMSRALERWGTQVERLVTGKSAARVVKFKR